MNISEVRGFTLIEILVVIAIIGILSSVVLGNINTARANGIDAAIKANLGGVHSQSEIFYDTNGDYGDDFAAADCTTAPAGTLFVDDGTIANQISDAATKSLAVAICASGNGIALPDGSPATSWAISVPLKTNPAQSWCVSSSGGGRMGVAVIDGAFEAVCQ